MTKDYFLKQLTNIRDSIDVIEINDPSNALYCLSDQVIHLVDLMKDYIKEQAKE